MPLQTLHVWCPFISGCWPIARGWGKGAVFLPDSALIPQQIFPINNYINSTLCSPTEKFAPCIFSGYRAAWLPSSGVLCGLLPSDFSPHPTFWLLPLKTPTKATVVFSESSKGTGKELGGGIISPEGKGNARQEPRLGTLKPNSSMNSSRHFCESELLSPGAEASLFLSGQTDLTLLFFTAKCPCLCQL